MQSSRLKCIHETILFIVAICKSGCWVKSYGHLGSVFPVRTFLVHLETFAIVRREKKMVIRMTHEICLTRKTKWLWQNANIWEIICVALIDASRNNWYIEWTLKKSVFSFFCIYFASFQFRRLQVDSFASDVELLTILYKRKNDGGSGNLHNAMGLHSLIESKRKKKLRPT